jgi:hypothetical protein
MGEKKPLPEDSQQQLAEQSLPALTTVANRLKGVTAIAFYQTIPYDPMDSADMMALSFATKEHEHRC